MYIIYIEQPNFLFLYVFLCIGYCMPQRCLAEIQPPFNEDILTVYESCNRPLSKAKTHFPTQFQTFNNLPHHCTTRESMQLGQQIWSFVRKKLIHLSFHETLPDVKGKIFTQEFYNLSRVIDLKMLRCSLFCLFTEKVTDCS